MPDNREQPPTKKPLPPQEPLEKPPPKAPSRVPGPSPAVLLGFSLLSTLIPFLLNWGVVGVADFDQFAAFNQIALWWHELGDRSVTWDPFLCGGATLVGNPQVPLYHVNLPVYWLFGPVNGLGMSFIPWAIVGFTGMFRLARYFGLEQSVAGWVAAAWILNGYFVGQLGSMHVMYTAFHLVPWIFYLNIHLARHGSWRAAGALPFVLGVGGLYNHHFLAYGFPFAVGHFLVECLLARREPGLIRKVTVHMVGVILSLGMIAVFFVPSFAWNSQYPRFKAGEFEPPLNLIQMLFLPVQVVPFEVEHDMFERYYTLGPLLFVFLVLGIVHREWMRPQLRGVVIVCVVAFLTAVGSLAPLGLPEVAPFDLIRRFVPGYQAIRVPSRFFINGLPAILLVVGFEWQRRFRTGNWSVARQLLVLAATLGPLWLFNFSYFEFSLFSEERARDRVRPAHMSDEFHWAEPGFRFRMMQKLEPNVGVLDCYEALEVPKAKTLDPGQGFVLDATIPHRVERISWGEMIVRINAADTSTAASGRVRFNFNHHRGWQVVTTDGTVTIVSKDRMPLTLELEGASFAHLKYVDPSWRWGAQISFVALGLSLLFLATCLLADGRAREKPPKSRLSALRAPTGDLDR